MKFIVPFAIGFGIGFVVSFLPGALAGLFAGNPLQLGLVTGIVGGVVFGAIAVGMSYFWGLIPRNLQYLIALALIAIGLVTFFPALDAIGLIGLALVYAGHEQGEAEA